MSNQDHRLFGIISQIEKNNNNNTYWCLINIEPFNQEVFNSNAKKLKGEKLKKLRCDLGIKSEDSNNQLLSKHDYVSFIRINDEIQDIKKIKAQDIVQHFGKNWTVNLNDNHLYIEKQIAESFLISILSALYLGRLVLLNGTVGVGKTSIVKHSAKILEGQSKIIPVRPAWIDPSDLLGFYNPLQEIFRPTPFLSALNKAGKDDKNRLHLVCLDELNLAKIENYASDVLSCLEYSKTEESFKLYAEEIEKNLNEEKAKLSEKQEINDKEKLRLNSLKEMLENYPANFKVPENVVLLGTLNSDETTYDLSPKLIDRSFLITYPPAQLEKLPLFSQSKIDSIHHLSCYVIKTIINYLDSLDSNLMFEDIEEDWKTINRWNNNYLKKGLGIPLGYRIFEDYKIFLSVGTYLGFSYEESFGYFIFTKILPRIKFFKDEENRKVELLQKWIEELKPYKNYDPANIIEKLRCQINEEQEQYISY